MIIGQNTNLVVVVNVQTGFNPDIELIAMRPEYFRQEVIFILLVQALPLDSAVQVNEIE